jgi:hypothetical protein
MPKHTNVRMSPKIMRLLALLEKGPKYGRQFAMIAPDLFFCNDEINRDGTPNRRQSSVASIYSILKRAEQGGLIEEMKEFKPPSLVIEDDPVGARRKYYCITIRGKEMLNKTRELLNPTEA